MISFLKKRIFYKVLVLILGVIFSSCIPDVNSNKGQCDTGETFNTTSRSCVVTSFISIPTLSDVTMNEDQDLKVTLGYRDHDDDYATSCAVTQTQSSLELGSCSCVGGVCQVLLDPTSDFNGTTDFSYTITDNDGTSTSKLVSVNVAAVNDTPTLTESSVDATEDTSLALELSSLVTDPDTGETFTFTITQDASLGDITPTSNTTGSFTFIPQTNISGVDTFKFMVVDSGGASSAVADMTIDIQGVDDAPVGTLSSASITEDSSSDIVLTYSDIDSTYDPSADSTADYCEVDISSDFGLELYNSSGCDCSSDGTCQFTLRTGKDVYTHKNSVEKTGAKNYEFVYRVRVGGTLSADQTVDVQIDESADSPIAFSQDVTADESNTVDATSLSFSITDATDSDIPDYESTTDLRFIIHSLPSHGTLTGCTASGDSTFDAYSTCIYTPETGNLTGVGTESTVDIKAVRYTSQYTGTGANGIRIYIVPDATTDKEFVKVEGQPQEATVDIFIHVVPSDTTQDGVLNLINNDSMASQFITVATTDTSNTNQADNTGDSTNDYLAGATDGADYFIYYVVDDASNASALTRVNFNIEATDDIPTLCQYSLYEEFSECGLNDCIGSSSPKGSLTPSASGVYFYDKSSSVCWKSNGTTNTSWEVVSSYVANQVVNEKDKIVISGIRLDEGGADASEDGQVLKLGIDVTSDNGILIPSANIKFYYGGVEVLPGATIDSTSESADAKEFKIEIWPVSGQSGTSNITFKIIDQDDSSIDITFNVSINATSASHNGWVAISSLGPKVNKYGQVRDESFICPYSETKCNSGSSCAGSGSPVNSVNPDVAYSIYYDSSGGTCYYSSSDSSADWTSFSTYCPISQSDLAKECDASSRGSCLFNVDSSTDITSAFSVDSTSDYNNIYYNLKTETCYRSLTNTRTRSLEEISAPASVRLEWNSFTISGDGTLAGYNVYRRPSIDDYDFDYKVPINKTLISSTITTYTDNGTNSKIPPIPGSVYFYEVRPVLTVSGTNIPTDTSEVFKTLRVVAPPSNMAFVHQAMANKGICSLMNKTSDPRYQYNCTYQGPGERIESDGTRTTLTYDLKHHLLVDRFEAGCNFTNPPVCNGTNDGSCIRISDPTGDVSDVYDNVDASDDTIFYDRSTGKCFIKVDDTVGNWKEIESSADITSLDKNEFDHRYAELPPFVNVTQEFGHQFCQLRSLEKVNNIIGISSNNLQTLQGRLPSRKEQIAYSLWPSTKTTSQIQTIEEGLSLNSTSKCNTSQANGLTTYYSDSPHPDSNTLFTLPGSSTSGIRSLMTGSNSTNGTANCVSQFGIQDAIGNVKEWVYDRIQCSGLSTCEGVIYGDTTWDALLTSDGTGDHFETSDSYGTFSKYKLDGKIGPCRDSDSDGECDAYMGEWEYDDQLYSAGRFILPMGLPAHTEFITKNYSSDISPFLLDIGPTSGITNARLANDKFILNSHHIFAEKTGCGSLATGGSYLSGGGAGVFHLEAIPCTETSYQYLTVGQISIKALHGKKPGLNLSISIGLGASGTVIYNNGDISADIGIVTDADPVYSEVVSLLNEATVDATVDVEISESDGSETVTELSSTSFNVIDSSPKRPDVGFRCVIPLNEDKFEVRDP